MKREEVFGMLNSILETAIEKKEKPEDVQQKLSKYLDFLSSTKYAENSDIETFKVICDNIPDIIKLSYLLEEKGAGIEIYPKNNRSRKIGFK